MRSFKYALLGLYGIIGMLVSTFGLFRVPFAESLAREHYRYAIGGVLIILLTLPVIAGVFILSFNANNYKTEIVQYVKAHTQRDLVLQGDIKVAFFPKLGLDTGKMLLSQRNSAREFATVNNARLYIAWLPLLKMQLVFDHVEIDGAHVNLTRYKDGSANYDDLLIRDGKLAPLNFDIDSARITASSLNWLDEIKWQRVALQDIQIETGSLADAVPSSLKASFHLNSEKAHSDASIELNSRLFYDRKEGRYEFSDIAGTLHGTAAGFSKLDLKFQGDLDSHPAQQLLSVENVAVTVAGNYGQRGIVAKLDMPGLQLAGNVWSGSDVTLDATVSQFDEKWAAVLQMPAFELSGDILNATQLGVDFKFSGDRRALQGKFSSPLSVDFGNKHELRLSAMTMAFSANHPMLSGELSGKATGSLLADLAAGNARSDFKATIDESDISGSLALTNFSQPAYSLDLDINRLALDRYISADWIKRYQDDAARVDLAGLKDIDLRGNLRVGEIRTSKFAAGKLAAKIRVEKSALTIDPLSARMYGGALSGSISVMARDTPQISIRQYLRGFQMSALLAATAASDKITGTGDLALDISAQGASIGELRKTLEGNVALVLAHGALAGIDMHSALLEGSDDLGTGGATLTRAAKFSQASEFSDLKATINFHDGSSRDNHFDMRSPLLRVAGVGSLAPDTGIIDYQLDATVAAALNRRKAGELDDLKGVTVPLRVYGNYASPTIALDLAAASGAMVAKRIAARAALEQATQRAAAQAMEQQAAATLAAKRSNAADKKPPRKASRKK